MRATRIAHSVVCIFGMGFLVIACTSQPEFPPNTPAPDTTPLVIQPTIFVPTDTPLPSATPAPTPTLIPPKPIAVPIPGQVDMLHPLYASTPAARTILGALFVGCVGENETGEPIALGCEQVPVADNGGATFVGEGADRYLQVTFKIRRGWRWTDGTSVTAQDAIYAWQLIMSPESGLGDPLAQSVYSMSATDDQTIVVNFMSATQAQAAAAGTLRGDVPFEYFSQLGDYAIYADRQTPLSPANYWAAARWLPSHLLRDAPPAQQRDSQFAAQPIGDGAFELASIDQGRVLLEPSAQPFPLGAPATNGIEFVLDDGAPVNLNESPAVLLDVPAEFVAVNNNILSTTTYPSGVEQLVLNVDRFPFDDVKVRQAVAHAIDRTAFLSDTAISPVNAINAALSLDLARSRALLAEAGWACIVRPCVKTITDTNGEAITRTLTFKLTTTEREPRNTVAQVIQKQLADVGFGVDIEIVFGLGKQSKMFVSYEQDGILLTRNFDAALYQTGEPAVLSGQFGCASIPTAESHDVTQGNAGGYCNEEIDRLIADAEGGESVISPQARTNAIAKATAAIEGAASVIPLYAPLRAVHSRGVSGLKPSQDNVITWNAWAWRTE